MLLNTYSINPLNNKDMITIKEELINHVGDIYEANILCAVVSYYHKHMDDDITATLKIGGNIDSFMNALSVKFENIYTLDATIWYIDGTWSTYEMAMGGDIYEGYWIRHVRPDIPEYLQNKGE